MERRKKQCLYKYPTNDQGRRTAVLVPIKEWENLQARIEYASDVTPEEIFEANAACKEHFKQPGKAKSIEQIMLEQLERRDD